jgi:hypothetical protein
MQISGMMAAASIALLGFGANLVSHLDRIDKSIGTAALTAGALFCWRCFSP